jgi:hypothetical protein
MAINIKSNLLHPASEDGDKLHGVTPQKSRNVTLLFNVSLHRQACVNGNLTQNFQASRFAYCARFLTNTAVF